MYRRKSMSSQSQTSPDVFEFFFEVEPVPASRPRVSRWGTHYGKRYESFRRAMRHCLLDVKPTRKLTGPIEAELEFIVRKSKSSKRRHPRGDVDNFVKGPLDSMTQAEKFWDDDDQVVVLVASKRFAEKNEKHGIRIRYRESTRNTPTMP